ncbi:MAG: DUF92 domain-containing protein [Thermomicrobium sp.]|nr:DUF92 domain-containing protein [Thermomicrobium sp.]
MSPPLRARLPRLATGALLATPIALVAYRRGALDRNGAGASVAVGTVVFAAGGLAWSLPMIGFFVSASALTKLGTGRRRRRVPSPASTDRSARTARQVLANGGVAAVLASYRFLCPGRADLTVPYLGAIATAAADTWGTELGMLSPEQPRSLRTGRPVAPGTSGAVSTVGILATAAGAGLVALLAPRTVRRWPILVAGCLGALVDSLLGATLQVRYRCPHCGRILEERAHGCSGKVHRASGLPGLTNDAVNLIATASGALLAAVLARLSRPVVRAPRAGRIAGPGR